MPQNHVFAMGVADGVFMWREQGIDSGDFSRALMRLSEASVLSGSADVVKVLQVGRGDWECGVGRQAEEAGRGGVGRHGGRGLSGGQGRGTGRCS